MKLGKGERPSRYPVTEERLEKSRIPRKLWQAKIDKIDKPAMRSKVEAYIQNLDELTKKGGLSVCLIGDQGVGKTSIAAILAKEFIARGQLVYFTSIPDLREAIREKTAYNEERSVPAQMREVEVVILDGLECLEEQDHYVNNKYIVELIKARRDEMGRNGPKIFIFTSSKTLQGELSVAVDSCSDLWVLKGDNKRANKINDMKALISGKKKSE